MRKTPVKYAVTLLLGVMLLALPVSLNGQVVQSERSDGFLLSRYRFGISDMLALSQYNTGAFGTARSVAMGGAFASLGADLSSMNINPAGLGMYRSSEFGFTPSVIFGNNESTTHNLPTQRDSRSRFSINNLGFALNLYQGSGTVTSFTLGFSYNKLADFNYNTTTRAQQSTGEHSIGRVFERQLLGINYNDLEGTAPWGYNSKVSVDRWGAALGNKSYMLDREAGTDDVYQMFGLSPTANVSHLMHTRSTGSIGEYSISGGLNIKNKVYVGLAIGIQDVSIRQTVGYYEDYTNNPVPESYRLSYIDYIQRTRTSGTGIDVKLGVIYRPFSSLRIGIAYHSPKFYSVDKEYSAHMYTAFAGDVNNQSVRTGNGVVANYDFSSPQRLILGVSYTLLQRAIFSLDYEATFYKGMRFDGGGYGIEQSYKTAIKENFATTNTVRAGLEVLLSPTFSARGGFTHVSTPLTGSNEISDSPVAIKQYTISAGLGINISRYAHLDFTYVYLGTEYQRYDMYYNIREYGGNSRDVIAPGGARSGIEQESTRHAIMASLSIKF